MGKIFSSENFVDKKKKNYFEGWYFRHISEFPFSYIVGITRNEGDEHSFIQYIDMHRSYYFRFGLDEFSFDKKDMTAKIGDNVFSLSGIYVDITDGETRVHTSCGYTDMVKFKKTAYSPSVMGPFSYLPMVCSHAVISMDHDFSGTHTVGETEMNLSGKGYIEKDFGDKFPDNYFWMHASSGDASIMFAVAWPLIFGIQGFLCIITHKGKQHNLSLYSGAKLDGLDVKPDRVKFKLTKGKTKLIVSAKSNDHAQKLIAPARGGKMDIVINENLTADFAISLTLDGEEMDLSNLSTASFESVLKD